MSEVILCPLCSNMMRQDGRYYRCIANQLHTCLIKEELGRFKSDEKDIKWLRWRMKVRLGKAVHQR